MGIEIETVETMGWPECSGVRVSVHLDPENEMCDTYSCVGGGTTSRIWNRLARVILRVPADMVEAWLADWLDTHRSEIETIAAMYVGSEWDGSNYRGKWIEDADSSIDALQAAFEQDYIDDSTAQYWEAGDWLGQAPEIEVLIAIKAAGSVEKAAAEYEAIAQHDGLHVRGIEDYLENLVPLLD